MEIPNTEIVVSVVVVVFTLFSIFSKAKACLSLSHTRSQWFVTRLGQKRVKNP